MDKEVAGLIAEMNAIVAGIDGMVADNTEREIRALAEKLRGLEGER